MAEKIKLGSNGNFGLKEGGTLAYNDENGVFKAIELASSRASGATYMNSNGVITDAESGVPRIDWTNGVGELLLEPQSTNYVTYSEDFSDASWLEFSTVGGTTTRTANYGISPDGTQNSTRIQFSSDNISVYKSVPTVGVGNYVSIYVKGTSGETIRFGVGTVVSDGENFTLNGEWQRLESEITSGSFFTLSTYAGVTARDIEVWGAQAEPLNYSTSYIRNLTTGSTSRIADAVTGNSSLGQVINSSEGVLYAEMSALASAVSGARAINIDDTTNNNRVFIQFDNASNNIRAGVVSGGSSYIVRDTSVAFGNIKVALKYSQNDLALWVNGVEVDTELVAPSMPSGLQRLNNGATAGVSFYGRIRELKVYDTALTDAELSALTTL